MAPTAWAGTGLKSRGVGRQTSPCRIRTPVAIPARPTVPSPNWTDRATPRAPPRLGGLRTGAVRLRRVSGQLELVPITLVEANDFVARLHRHHEPVVGSKFQVAVAFGGEVVGVAIVGRPVSRHLDDGWTLEVN